MGNKVIGEIIEAKINESKPLCSLGKSFFSLIEFLQTNRNRLGRRPVCGS